MSPPVHHRNFWSIDALTRMDFMALLDMASALRRSGSAGDPHRPLRGKNLALLGNDATDGRWTAFRRAATELGAQVSHVRPGGSPDEDVTEAARLLGRLYDAVDCEGLDLATVQKIDREAGVPVFNGLTHDDHPTHVVATLLDLQSRAARPLRGLRVAFMGNLRTPRGDALLQAAALTGMELRIAAAPEAEPDAQRLARARRIAQGTGARLVLVDSPEAAVEGADVVLDERDGIQAPSADDRRYALQAVLVSALCH